MTDLAFTILCGLKRGAQRAIGQQARHLHRCRNFRGWVSLMADDGMAHVYPLRDAISHEAWDECPCGPTITAEYRNDGSNGWLATHHSLDGREANERQAHNRTERP